MIYVKSSIEPHGKEEFDILSISLMRKTEARNEIGEYKYVYGGWWKDRSGEVEYISGFVYNDRDNSIMVLISKICLDIENKVHNIA